MKYLEAVKLVKSLTSTSQPLSVLLASSFQSEAWAPYIQAMYANTDRKAIIGHLPFNSLHQSMLSDEVTADETILLLCPWDFFPNWNWRLGYPQHSVTVESAIQEIYRNAEILFSNKAHSLVYIQAPVKPLFASTGDEAQLHAAISRILSSTECPHTIVRSADISHFLTTGQLLNGVQIGDVIDALIREQTRFRTGGKKLLITDLDNTLWSGVIGEDGTDGIDYRNQGKGYPFFLYQSLLKQLRRTGTLLAAVSKNDSDLAHQPFLNGEMILNERDMIAIAASYDAKSAQIRALSKALDLPTSSFVFVDDNHLELEEVSAAIPDIDTIHFSPDSGALASLLQQLVTWFPLTGQTEEDSERTALYRTRLKGFINRPEKGSDLTEYLKNLKMTLAVSKVNPGNHDRALQLINKTNQFNLNGLRLTEAELISELDAGSALWIAELSDQYGSHGEVIGCLVNDNHIQHLVMSCRVLNREAEYAFLNTVLTKTPHNHSMSFDFKETERNTPMKKFIKSLELDESKQATKATLERIKRSSHLFKVITANES